MGISWVACGYALALAFLLLGCLTVRRSVPGLRGMRAIQWAVAMATLSSLARVARLWVPPLVISLANNYLFLAWLLLICRASEELLQKRSRFFGIIAASWVAALPLFWHFRFASTGSIVTGSALKAFAAGLTAVLCFGGSPAVPGKQARMLGALHACFSAMNLGRCVLTVLHPPGFWGPVNPLQTGFAYGQLIYCFATCCGMVWLSVDERNQELRERAETDSLSGLLNRRAFEAALARETQRGVEMGSLFALVLVDLDHFKKINDTFGHGAGDEVIRRVSEVLKQGVRSVDTLARYGGEEYAILLRDATLEDAESVAERLRSEIAKITAFQGSPQITASLGLAMSRSPESPGDLFHRCDQALYQSKRSGRNLVTVSPLSGAGQA